MKIRRPQKSKASFSTSFVASECLLLTADGHDSSLSADAWCRSLMPGHARIRLRGLAPLRKQVAWLRTGLAASRRLFSCSPTRTEVGAPASERRLAASEDPRRKGLKHLTHTRSDEIRCTTGGGRSRKSPFSPKP